MDWCQDRVNFSGTYRPDQGKAEDPGPGNVSIRCGAMPVKVEPRVITSSTRRMLLGKRVSCFWVEHRSSQNESTGPVVDLVRLLMMFAPLFSAPKAPAPGFPNLVRPDHWPNVQNRDIPGRVKKLGRIPVFDPVKWAGKTFWSVLKNHVLSCLRALPETEIM